MNKLVKQLDMDGPIMAFSSYKPKEGKKEEFMNLLDNHLPKLRELELASSRQPYLAQSSDGRVIEVFEWVSADAVEAAHQHPAVLDIWEKMALVADFLPMNTIPEGKEPFVSFKLIE